MLDPKTFYRDFDSLLTHITTKRPEKNFLASILDEFVSHFGSKLNITTWRLFEERGNDFVLIGSSQNGLLEGAQKRISSETEAVKRVTEKGSYIFDSTDVAIEPFRTHQDGQTIPAAFTVDSPRQRWLVVFQLQEGWVREEITFALNAIRTVLNYRLYSESIQSDLEQATQIQRSLLPSRDPSFLGYDIAGRSDAAKIVGGDLYDYFEFDEELMGVCIGDASGHGLPAALLVRDVVIGLRMGLEKQMKMVYTLQKLNHVIHRSTFSSRFVSMFYGELERDGHLIYVNAGHPAPLLVQGDRVQELKATGLILGALPEITLHRSNINIEPDSLLVLYTDGIFERVNRKEVGYSIDRLKKLLVRIQEKSAAEVRDAIFDDVFEYGGRTRWEDDSTVVVIKRNA